MDQIQNQYRTDTVQEKQIQSTTEQNDKLKKAGLLIIVLSLIISAGYFLVFYSGGKMSGEDKVEEYVLQGWTHLNKSEYSEAIESFSESINLYPVSSAYAGKGLAYYYEGEIDKARENFNKALELNKENKDAYIGLGWLNIHFKVKNDVQAEQYFKKGIESMQEDDSQKGSLLRAYEGLGSAQLMLKKYGDAESSFKKAISLDPNFHNAHSGLGWTYYQQGKYEEAKTEFQTAIKLDPYQSPSAHVGLGWVYYQASNYEEAKTEFQIALKINPKSDMRRVGGGHQGLGWVYYQQERYEEAKTEFKKAFDINPDNELTIEGIKAVESKL